MLITTVYFKGPAFLNMKVRVKKKLGQERKNNKNKVKQPIIFSQGQIVLATNHDDSLTVLQQFIFIIMNHKENIVVC